MNIFKAFIIVLDMKITKSRLKKLFFTLLILVLPFTLLWASLFALHRRRLNKFNEKVIETISEALKIDVGIPGDYPNNVGNKFEHRWLESV